MDQETTSLENIAEDEKILYDSFGFPTQDEPYHWSLDIALKVDLMALEAIYALEEKITNASMQNKVSRGVDDKQKKFYSAFIVIFVQQSKHTEIQFKTSKTQGLIFTLIFILLRIGA